MGLPIKGSAPQTSPQVVVSQAPSMAALDTLSAELHNTLVIYGPSGSRKTTQIGEFAKYIYEKTGKKTRLITADGGGYGPIQNYVNAGIIEPWRIVEEKYPKVALIKASKGAWPVKLENGLRTSPNLYEPTTKEEKAKALKDVGAYAVESWASIAALLMSDLVAKGQKISEEVVGKFSETADFGGEAESFGAPGRSHYGWVQNFILTMIRNFGSLPVERVLYTSLEGKGEDQLSKILQYGPLVAGRAITASIPTYVGDCLHFEDFTEETGVDPANPKQKLIEGKVRVWFTQHPDTSTGTMWPAKPRIVGDQYASFKQRMGPSGYFVLDNNVNLGSYLRLQDEILQTASDSARVWRAEVDRKREAQAAEKLVESPTQAVSSN